VLGIVSAKHLQSVKRTAELSKHFNRPLRGLIRRCLLAPSTKVLGYFHSSRFAGLNSQETEPLFFTSA